jgi:hypothetical protein
VFAEAPFRAFLPFAKSGSPIAASWLLSISDAIVGATHVAVNGCQHPSDANARAVSALSPQLSASGLRLGWEREPHILVGAGAISIVAFALDAVP